MVSREDIWFSKLSKREKELILSKLEILEEDYKKFKFRDPEIDEESKQLETIFSNFRRCLEKHDTMDEVVLCTKNATNTFYFPEKIGKYMADFIDGLRAVDIEFV